MNKLLLNSFREFKNRFNDIINKYNELKFGLSLISDKRYNYYYKVVLFTTSAVTTGLYLSYNTIFIDKYKAVVNTYSCGDLSILSSDLQLFANNVFNDCNQTKQMSSHLMSFFPSVGSEPISIGTTGLMTGAMVGLTHNLSFNTVDDVNTLDLRFFGEHKPHLRWRSVAGKALLQSLVLSEKAKKFVIGRQIHLANNWTLLMDCLNVWCSTLLAICLAQEFIKITNFPKRFGQRLVIRSVSLVIGFYIWSTINSIINYYSTLRADKRTVSLGADYFEGGIEYYSKLIARNAGFYAVEEQRGHKLFTEDGEIRGLFTSRLLTISRKLDLLKTFEQQIRDQNEAKPNL